MRKEKTCPTMMHSITSSPRSEEPLALMSVFRWTPGSKERKEKKSGLLPSHWKDLTAFQVGGDKWKKGLIEGREL